MILEATAPGLMCRSAGFEDVAKACHQLDLAYPVRRAAGLLRALAGGSAETDSAMTDAWRGAGRSARPGMAMADQLGVHTATPIGTAECH